MNPLEALERADRDRRRSRHVSDVKLHHFIAGTFSSLSNCDFHGDVFSGLHLFRSRELGVCKSRVAQPVTKRKQRLALEVAVRAAGHSVVLERWELSHGFVEGYREPA